MKLKFEAAKGRRIKYGFMGFTTFDFSGFKTENSMMGYTFTSSHESCRSVRAFQRKLKKYSGYNFVLVSRWFGYDVYSIKKE